MEATSVGELDSPAQVLAAARVETRAAETAEARRLQLAVAWADQHPAESLEAAEVFRSSGYWGGFGDNAVPIAGPGAPLVAEFSVAEFAAAVGLSTDAGKQYLGQAVELRYRLPRLWKRVMKGELPAWKARRVAHETISRALTTDAAAHVDRHLAPVAHKVGVAATDRMVEEAIARHMPETAEATRRNAADGRHFEVDHHQISFAGTSLIHGELDLADALDLDAAVTHRAAQLKDLGCPESLDVRRAMAIGEIARHQLALGLDTISDGDSSGVEEGAPAPVSKPRNPGRQVVLYVHLHQSAIDGANPVGRVENTHQPVTAEQIRGWCGHPDARVTVKPVIDLADHVHVEAYEVPDRIAEAVAL
ncbi:MAG: HNH endonuclease, partial [Nocardioides sp.]